MVILRKFSVFLIPVLFGLSGCASQMMEKYIGQPIETVMLDNGPAAHVFDMPDQTRIYQWTAVKSYTAPVHVDTSETSKENAAKGSSKSESSTIITGGQTTNTTCVYSYYTRWNPYTSSYYVTGFRQPSFECE